MARMLSDDRLASVDPYVRLAHGIIGQAVIDLTGKSPARMVDAVFWLVAPETAEFFEWCGFDNQAPQRFLNNVSKRKKVVERYKRSKE